MLPRLAAALVLLALAAAPAAAGDGPMPTVLQGGEGVLSRDGTTRYVTSVLGIETAFQVIGVEGGAVQATLDLDGTWGVPTTTYIASRGEGLSADGRTLVLGGVPTSYPPQTSSFLVLDPRRLRIERTFTLRGDFAYDAISPHGRRLYLIQHVDASDTQRYVVREYDLAAGRLLPGRIADRTQRSWVMRGSPVSRVTSADGRWVYTLYANPGGYPFVHALDTVRGVAHCVGVPWHGSDNAHWNMRVSLRGAGTLTVHWASGRRWLTVDTRTWRVSPDAAGMSRLWIGLGAGGAAAVAVAVLLALRRRRRAEELEQELADLLRPPEREVVV